MPNQSLFDDDVCEHGIKKRWGECEIILSWQPSLAEACVVNSSSLGPSLKSKPFKLQCRMPHFINSGEPKFHSIHLPHSINHCTDIYSHTHDGFISLFKHKFGPLAKPRKGSHKCGPHKEGWDGPFSYDLWAAVSPNRGILYLYHNPPWEIKMLSI